LARTPPPPPPVDTSSPLYSMCQFVICKKTRKKVKDREQNNENTAKKRPTYLFHFFV
jgi:hypothetical protein